MTNLSNLKTSSRTGLLALALIVGASALSPASAQSAGGNGGGGNGGNGGEPGLVMAVSPPHFAIAVNQPAPQRPRRTSQLDLKTCTGPMQSVTVGCQVMNSSTR
jgi:hypothetical protein